MSCAACGSASWQAIGRVGAADDAIERRECLTCGHTWTARGRR